MRKFCFSIMFILAGLFAADRIGGLLMWQVLKHSNDAASPKIIYLSEQATEDVILMGTSRCDMHYVPSIIADSIKMSIYNGGIEQSYCIYAQYFMLRQLLLRHTPRLICLEISPYDYEKNAESFSTLGFFAPLIGRDASADSLFRFSGKYHAYRISHLLRYNSRAASNIEGMAINLRANDDHGYRPLLNPNRHPQALLYEPRYSDIDTLKLDYLSRFIDTCKSKNIHLVLTISPRYTIPSHDLYEPLKTLANRKGILVMDYHSSGLFKNHPEFFRDENHLWDHGARRFSEIFGHNLKQLIDNDYQSP